MFSESQHQERLAFLNALAMISEGDGVVIGRVRVCETSSDNGILTAAAIRRRCGNNNGDNAES